jgi:threonine synthase
MVEGTGSLLRRLECRSCCTEADPGRPVGVCPTCGHALLAGYELGRLDAKAWWRGLSDRPATLWRYRELLPVASPGAITTLGEPTTPIVSLGPVPEVEGVELELKDDGGLPTGSFKARGMAVAVSRARELGLETLYVPSAGNAGVALAAYGARARARVRVYLPEATPGPMPAAARAYGAEVRLLPGTLREVGAAARKLEAGGGGFDMSTLREPYRVEGKKTMGLEIAEQSESEGWPDAIVYPTGGGTGLVGMFKAFSELTTLGLLDRMPRLLAVQPEGCAPVVRALRDGSPRAEPWENPGTIAPGLLVPAPFASERVLEAIRGTRGDGVTVSDREIVEALRALATRHGISASPEGAATYAALRPLHREKLIRPGETVLLYNTGSGIPFSGADWDRRLAPACG